MLHVVAMTTGCSVWSLDCSGPGHPPTPGSPLPPALGVGVYVEARLKALGLAGWGTRVGFVQGLGFGVFWFWVSMS